MAVFEVKGGRIDHRYLMHKRVSWLKAEADWYAKELGDQVALDALTKRDLANLIMRQLARLEERQRSAAQGAQGE